MTYQIESAEIMTQATQRLGALGSSAAIMMVDREMSVIHANRKVKDLLLKHEKAFREVVPDFDSGEIIGCSFDTFHRPDMARPRSRTHPDHQ